MQCCFKHKDVWRKERFRHRNIVRVCVCVICITGIQLHHRQRAALITGILSIGRIHAARLSSTISLRIHHITSHPLWFKAKVERRCWMCVCAHVQMYACAQYVSLCSLWKEDTVIGPSFLKREKHNDGGSREGLHRSVRAEAHLCVSLHMSISECDGCLLCCLIAVLSVGNRCAAHCRNGLSNLPVSGRARIQWFSS